MKNNICLLLIFAMQFGFAQKKYDFTNYTVYQSVNADKVNIKFYSFNDTNVRDYFFLIIAENDTLKNGYLIDYQTKKEYSIQLKDKTFETFNFSKDILSSNECSFEQFIQKDICKDYEYFEQKTAIINDSTKVQQYSFFKNRRKNKLRSVIEINYLETKNSSGAVPSKELNAIINCIDDKFKTKIIKNIRTRHFENNLLKSVSDLKHIQSNTINFSIILNQ